MKRIISAAAAAVMLTGCAAGDGSSAENSSAAQTAEKTDLVWLTGADMPYQDNLNDYLDSAGYDFHIKFKTITNDFDSRLKRHMRIDCVEIPRQQVFFSLSQPFEKAWYKFLIEYNEYIKLESPIEKKRFLSKSACLRYVY